MYTAVETTCLDCGKVFRNANAFKRHFRQYHKKKESDIHSESKFYTEFMLKNHIGQMVEAHEAILAGSGH